MPRTTATVPEDLDDWIERKAESDEFDSKAEVVRTCIRTARRLDDTDADVDDLLDAHDRVEHLERELEVTENKLTEAREQMKHRDRVEEKVDTLAKRVEDHDGPDPPFPVRWWQWIRSRGEGEERGE